MERKINIRRPIKPDIPSFLRVAAYVRVSSLKDAMLESLSNQVSYYNDCIQRHAGWQYTGVYVDEGLTGTKDARPEFQRLLADCKSGKIDMIITKSTTRFARNTVTMLETVRMLKEIGVDVFFEKENIHSISGDGELMLTILASFAQEESRSVSENCKWRLQEKMKQGEQVGLRGMYGYNVSKNSISIEPDQAKIVRQIFDWYVSGDSSVVIAKRLNAAGELTLNRVAWCAKHVRDILKNEKYAGNTLLQKSYITDHLNKRKKRNHGELPQYYVEQSHAAIIDQETFDKAQTILTASFKRNQPAKPVCARYPLTGKIVCGNCGKHFQRKTTKGRISWHCSTYLEHGKSACPARQIPEETILRAATNTLGQEIFDETEFNRRIERIQVPEPNRFIFIFSNGDSIECDWAHRSRSGSWTDEMKQAARERDQKRRQEQPCQQ
ncbi:MAG: recombinase family protein [Christensenella sp.]|nr:recombinase family protein [Christensenella sp.]